MKVREFDAHDMIVTADQEVWLFRRFDLSAREVRYEALESPKTPEFDFLL
jgi:hypothetical protein